MRSAPETGYDFSAKRDYRRKIWSTLTNGLHGKPTANVLVMPSLEGDELDIILQKGFRQRNLHVVDRNPAIVAHLKRRYPEIQTYGVELFDAIGRMVKKDIRIDVANLDLCCPIGNQIGAVLIEANKQRLWNFGARLAVNTLRGREKGDSLDLLNRTKKQHTELLSGTYRWNHK